MDPAALRISGTADPSAWASTHKDPTLQGGEILDRIAKHLVELQHMSMPLGYRGNATWRDMSEYVVHFAKSSSNDSAFDVMMSILSEGRIEARTRFGAARSVHSVEGQYAACFSEIPLDLLDRLVHRRGTRHGIGFRQEHVVAAGGGRVWYVENQTAAAQAVRDLVQEAQGPPFRRDHPIWCLTPLIDLPGSYGSTRYRFEWEREWRVAGDFSFHPEDVAFLFMPEELHQQARDFFERIGWDNSGPVYDCPLLDPLWSEDQIRRALG